MMCTLRYLLALLAFAWSHVSAQELTLQKDCEAGFRHVIRLAQTGVLGADVANANVRVDGQRVELELVRTDAPNKVFRLAPKASAQVFSRYFDIMPSTGAAATDAERIGRALNAAFLEDPFVIVVTEGSRGDNPIPSILAAWGYGGWHGVARVLERRMMVLATARYTVAVIAFLIVGMCASLAVLWGSVPPPRM